MPAKTILAAAFLLVIGITLVFPSLPPAQLLSQYLEIPQPTQSIWGISLTTILNGITNGLFWLAIAATIYGLARYRESDPLPPMPVPPKLSTPPPEPTPVDTRTNKIPPLITVNKQPVESEQSVEMINGIGPTYGESLRNSGIETVNDLIRAGATKLGRQRLANRVGVTYASVLKWVHRGDLLRINGIGKKYSALLESAGVNTITDLSMKNPSYLCQKLRMLNKEKRLVRRTPPSKTIEIWVRSAKTLERIVE
jgi:predicted flap endonuclease-1-like 5' DNA nuclease